MNVGGSPFDQTQEPKIESRDDITEAFQRVILQHTPDLIAHNEDVANAHKRWETKVAWSDLLSHLGVPGKLGGAETSYASAYFVGEVAKHAPHLKMLIEQIDQIWSSEEWKTTQKPEEINWEQQQIRNIIVKNME